MIKKIADYLDTTPEYLIKGEKPAVHTHDKTEEELIKLFNKMSYEQKTRLLTAAYDISRKYAPKDGEE